MEQTLCTIPRQLLVSLSQTCPSQSYLSVLSDLLIVPAQTRPPTSREQSPSPPEPTWHLLALRCTKTFPTISSLLTEALGFESVTRVVETHSSPSTPLLSQVMT